MCVLFLARENKTDKKNVQKKPDVTLGGVAHSYVPLSLIVTLQIKCEGGSNGLKNDPVCTKRMSLYGPYVCVYTI